MSKQPPPSAEAMNLARRIRNELGGEPFLTSKEAAADIDALCEQRVEAERERCAELARQYRDPDNIYLAIKMGDVPPNPPAERPAPEGQLHPCQCLVSTMAIIECEFERGNAPRLGSYDKEHGISQRFCRKHSLRGVGVEQPTQDTGQLGCGDEAAEAEIARLKDEIQWMNRKLMAGTLHVGHCNADHEAEIGGPGCSCPLGRIIKTLRHEAVPSARASTGEQPGCGEWLPITDNWPERHGNYVRVDTQEGALWGPDGKSATHCLIFPAPPNAAGGPIPAGPQPETTAAPSSGITALLTRASDMLCRYATDYPQPGALSLINEIDRALARGHYSPPAAVVDYTERARELVRAIEFYLTSCDDDDDYRECNRVAGAALSAVASERDAEIAALKRDVRRHFDNAATMCEQRDAALAEMAALWTKYEQLAAKNPAALLARLREPSEALIDAVAEAICFRDPDMRAYQNKHKARAALTKITEMLTP